MDGTSARVSDVQLCDDWEAMVRHVQSLIGTVGLRYALSFMLALGLSGCGGATEADESSSDPAWVAPQEYRFDLDAGCGERDPVGLFRVLVRDGEVADAHALDKLGKQRYSRGRLLRTLPTLTDLEDRVRSAQDQGAAVATITYGPRDGQPVRVRIDQNARVTDDEECYVVSKYAASK